VDIMGFRSVLLRGALFAALACPLAGCLAVGLAGAAVGVAGKAVVMTAKGAGAVVGAVIPGDKKKSDSPGG
jgi:hypothetical protein